MAIQRIPPTHSELTHLPGHRARGEGHAAQQEAKKSRFTPVFCQLNLPSLLLLLLLSPLHRTAVRLNVCACVYVCLRV